MDPRKRVVRDGYDTLAGRYGEWAGAVEGSPRERMIEEFLRRLPDSPILDLGCGGTGHRYGTRGQVVGVDLSIRQLELARTNGSAARLVQADMADVAFRPETFGGVVAMYSITHVPREEHAELFRRIATWLVPGGLLLASLASGDSEWTGGWLGVPMYFSGQDDDTNRRLLQAAGFRLLLDEAITEREPETEATFLWVLARRRA